MIDGIIKSKRQGVAGYFLYFMFFYMCTGVYTSFSSVYFQQRGCTQTQIGLIASIGPIAAVFSQFLFGRIADKLKNKHILVFVLLVTTIAVLFVFPFAGGFFVLLTVNTIYSFFNCNQQLADVIALDYCENADAPYGKIRMGGTIGYAFMAAFAGYFLVSDVSNMFYICIGVLCAASLCLLLLPVGERRVSAEQARHSYRSLFKNKTLLFLFVLNFFIYVPQSFFNTFYPLYITNAVGGSITLVGYSTLVGVLCELPFLFFSERLCRKFGIYKLLFFASAITVVKYLATAWIGNAIALVALNALYGGTNIVFAYCSAVLISRSVAEDLKASGQMLLGIITYGLCRIIGNGLGGVLSDSVGLGSVFFICAALGGVALVLSLFKIRAKGEVPNETV